jgi:hypothetical protein
VAGARRPVELGAARQPAVDHHGHTVERQRGFGNRCRQHDPAAPLRIAPDRRALPRRIDLTVKRQDDRIFQPFFQPFARPLDFTDTGQEDENIAVLFSPCGEHGRRHGVLDPFVRRSAKPFDRQRMRFAFAFDHWRAFAKQRREARAVNGRTHHHHAQVFTQHRPAFQREREAEIAVEMPFMRFVEQHSRHACQLRIVDDAVDENRFGNDQYARLRPLPAVHPGEIADRFAGLFAQYFSHALGRCACGDPARRRDDHLPAAPIFADQLRRDGGGLACTRRRHQHRARLLAKRGQQLGQDGLDG